MATNSPIENESLPKRLFIFDEPSSVIRMNSPNASSSAKRLTAAEHEERETGRLEGFSDGVFAFAITLLVLNLREPIVVGTGTLLEELFNQWPTFFALVTSFMTILIMWVNHHNMFNYIRRIDTQFMLLNGFLLFFVVLTPFTTSFVADHLLSKDSGTAAAVYSGTFLLLGIAWTILWRYAQRRHKLLGRDVTDSRLKGINRLANIGLLLYVAAFLASLLSGLASVILILLQSVYLALVATVTGRK